MQKIALCCRNVMTSKLAQSIQPCQHMRGRLEKRLNKFGQEHMDSSNRKIQQVLKNRCLLYYNQRRKTATISNVANTVGKPTSPLKKLDFGGESVSKKEYRSAVRSRRMIQEAFERLLLEKEWQKITVTDIVSRADINRSTFYAHYPDVRGVIEEKLSQIVECTLEAAGQDVRSMLENPLPCLQSLSELLKKNEALCRRQDDGMLERLRQMLEEMFMRRLMEILSTGNQAVDRATRRCIAFYLSGVFGYYLQLMRDGGDEPLEEISEELSVCVRGTREVLQKLPNLAN